MILLLNRESVSLANVGCFPLSTEPWCFAQWGLARGMLDSLGGGRSVADLYGAIGETLEAWSVVIIRHRERAVRQLRRDEAHFGLRVLCPLPPGEYARLD